MRTIRERGPAGGRDGASRWEAGNLDATERRLLCTRWASRCPSVVRPDHVAAAAGAGGGGTGGAGTGGGGSGDGGVGDAGAAPKGRVGLAEVDAACGPVHGRRRTFSNAGRESKCGYAIGGRWAVAASRVDDDGATAL